MKNTLKNAFLATAAAATLVSGVMADTRPIIGEARTVDTVQRRLRNRRAAAELTVPVTVDLTSVTRGSEMPVLGAYVAEVRFDPKQIVLLRVDGGTASHFDHSPVATATAKANAEGLLLVTYAHTDTNAPTGIVNVANVIFRERTVGGTASVQVRFTSLAAAIEMNEDGTFSSDIDIPIEINK